MSTLDPEHLPSASPSSAPAGGGQAAASTHDPAVLAAIASRVKQLIVEDLHLEGLTPQMIEDDAPLFGDGLGLDSVDALELVVAIEKEYGIKIKSNEIGREVFTSVSSLARFIAGRI